MEQSMDSAIIVSKVNTPAQPQKVINESADEENIDSKSSVPFLQLLNQQVTLLNQVNASVNELPYGIDDNTPTQIKLTTGDFQVIKDEKTNGVLKQNQIAAMVKELSEMKGSLPENGGIAAKIDADFEAKLKKQMAMKGASQESGKVPLLKTEDITNGVKSSEQAMKDNYFKLPDNLGITGNGSKISAGRIADKVGLANMDSLQAFAANMAEKFDNASKEKINSAENYNQDISTNLLNGTTNGAAKVNSIDDISSGQIINRIASAIKENVSTDGGRVKLTLSPPSLGTLEMDITVRNNKVEVIIVANNKDVQQTLNTNIDNLKGTLQNHGLTIERCDVLMQNNREGYPQPFSQQTFYRDGSEKNSNNSKEKYNEEIKPISAVKPQIINSPSLNPDNISIFA